MIICDWCTGSKVDVESTVDFRCWIFLSAFSLPHGQLWVIIESKASLTRF